MKHAIDKKLFLDLLRIPSPSMGEENVSNYITNYLDNIGIKYTQDIYGNIYNIDDKNKPILNAHMDTVQGDFDCKLTNFIDIYNNEFIKGYGVIGGDDKCGIYIILHLLKFKVINFIFTVEEESGGHGIKTFLMEHSLKEYPYVLTLDRKGNSDIICSGNEYGTITFEKDLEMIGEKYGYKATFGVWSDADEISNDISCANLSVGYYNAHTEREFIVLSDVENAINYIEDILNTLIDVKYPSPIKRKSYRNINHYYDDYGVLSTYDDEFFTEEEMLYEYPEYKCLITNKVTNDLYYLSGINKYISMEGARKLLADLEDSGILEDIELFNNDEEIRKIMEG